VKAMNGLDRMFMNIESGRMPMDFMGIFILDPSTSGGGHDFDRVRTELAARLPAVPVFTHRLVSAPFGAGTNTGSSIQNSRSIDTSHTSPRPHPTTCRLCAIWRSSCQTNPSIAHDLCGRCTTSTASSFKAVPLPCCCRCITLRWTRSAESKSPPGCLTPSPPAPPRAPLPEYRTRTVVTHRPTCTGTTTRRAS
jgi:wax ester synthase-like acyl-CoA acyltransferase family protein